MRRPCGLSPSRHNPRARTEGRTSQPCLVGDPSHPSAPFLPHAPHPPDRLCILPPFPANTASALSKSWLSPNPPEGRETPDAPSFTVTESVSGDSPPPSPHRPSAQVRALLALPRGMALVLTGPCGHEGLRELGLPRGLPRLLPPLPGEPPAVAGDRIKVGRLWGRMGPFCGFAIHPCVALSSARQAGVPAPRERTGPRQRLQTSVPPVGGRPGGPCLCPWPVPALPPTPCTLEEAPPSLQVSWTLNTP